MGACCTGKEHKVEVRHEEIHTRMGRSNYQDSNLPDIDYEIEKSELSKLLTNLVKKYSKHEDKLLNPITTYSIEQLWNICKYHNDDYTSSEYLLLDVRESAKRKENFLKKFRMINYTLPELKMLNSTAIAKFKKYIAEKFIIIVSDVKSIETVDETVGFLIDMDIRIKLCLLDTDFENLSHSSKHLLNFLEDRHFQSLPYLYLSMRYFPRIGSDKYIFISQGIGKMDSNTLASFRQVYNINTVIDVTDKPTPAKKEKGLSHINLICKGIDDLVMQKDSLVKIADTIRDKLKSNSCCLINITDIQMGSELILYLAFFLALKVVNINFKKLRYYAFENFLFIPGIKEHCTVGLHK
jgi:hypothetical protein